MLNTKSIQVIDIDEYLNDDAVVVLAEKLDISYGDAEGTLVSLGYVRDALTELVDVNEIKNVDLKNRSLGRYNFIAKLTDTLFNCPGAFVRFPG